MILVISRCSGDYIDSIDLTPLEIIYPEHHPFILLQITDDTTQRVLILCLQEVKREIIFPHAQLMILRKREELQPRIQAHLLSVINKIHALLRHLGVLRYTDALALLQRRTHIILHD
jgi:hypothetical protein